MAADRVPEGEATTTRFADMRYVGQGYTLDVPVPLTLDAAAMEAVVAEFHAIHERIYGHSHPGALTEFVNVRVVQDWGLPRPNLEPAPQSESAPAPGSRSAYFEELGGYVDTPIYQRGSLRIGDEIAGPAIVEQADTTLVIYPNQYAVLDDAHNLIVAVSAGIDAAAEVAVAS
jgi:N-methylhydantoinase A